MNDASRNDTPGLAARRSALRLLDAVLRQGRSLDEAIPSAGQGLSRQEDRAMALAMASETLRWMPDLDRLIDSATRLRLGDDAKVRSVLRLMLTQALRLSTPPHAVIAASLPLLNGGPRRLAHGVFGTLLRNAMTLPDAPALPDEPQERWQRQWGAGMVDAAKRALAELPPVDLSWKAEPFQQRDEADPAGESLAPDHLRMARSGSIERLGGFGDGHWWVQDLAASLPARLLGTGEGRTVLDLCAAPGGKTMQLADKGWAVTAIDKSKRRLDMLRQNLARTQLSASVTEADLMQWQPKTAVDAVLLDAPCSATGIFRRHPDVLYRANDRQIDEMADVQRTLLNRVADWVKPGGVLVYAVCSLEKAEGEDQITAFLTADSRFHIDPVMADELPHDLAPTAEGWVRTLPGMLGQKGGLDGFFTARLIRQR